LAEGALNELRLPMPEGALNEVRLPMPEGALNEHGYQCLREH